MCKCRYGYIYILEFIKRNYEKHNDQAGVQKYIEALQMGIDALKKESSQNREADNSENVDNTEKPKINPNGHDYSDLKIADECKICPHISQCFLWLEFAGEVTREGQKLRPHLCNTIKIDPDGMQKSLNDKLNLHRNITLNGGILP